MSPPEAGDPVGIELWIGGEDRQSPQLAFGDKQPVEDEAGVEEEEADDPLRPLQLAIVGRPNAGKSTLINRLLGEDRLLTGPEAGITRDSIAVEWT